MSRLLPIPVALVALALQAAPTLAQSEGGSAIGPAQPGSFQRAYPEAARLLNPLNGAYGLVLERLYTGGDVEGATFEEALASIRAGGDASSSIVATMPSLAADEPQIAQVLAWGHNFEHALFDIFTDPAITDRAAAVDLAVERYLARTDAALPATPKAMSGAVNHEHMLLGGHHSMQFQQDYPNANRLVWGAHWLQIALFDPLLFYRTEAEQRDGIAHVVTRFNEIVADAPESLPQQMPTPAAIAPELLRLYPRAAAILDNLHILQGALADALVDTERDRNEGMRAALSDVMDPEHMTVSEYDWVVSSLRHGIFYQGGPAIGRLDRPERNFDPGEHNHGGGMSMPPGAM